MRFGLVLCVLLASTVAHAEGQQFRLASGATRLAMLPVKCARDMSPELCSALDESLSVELGRDPRLDVVAPHDLEVMMGAQQLVALQDCDGDSCFNQPALQQAQAKYLVAVVIGRIGNDALITARIVDLQRETVLDRDDIRVPRHSEADIDEATRTLVQNILVRRGLATPMAAPTEARGAPVAFWTGVGLTGLGVAGLGAALGLGTLAAIGASGLNTSSSVDPATFESVSATSRQQALGADLALAGGGVALVAGVVMIIVGSL
jgi:hypothetical protein